MTKRPSVGVKHQLIESTEFVLHCNSVVAFKKTILFIGTVKGAAAAPSNSIARINANVHAVSST